MGCVDVNLLVSAHRPEAADHDRYRAWLEEARRADEPLGLSGLVLSGFPRVVTHPRILREPTPLDIALDAVRAWRATPNAIEPTPGPRHFEIFTRLCEAADARGNLIPDAYLAAKAVERGATWYSADRGLARSPTSSCAIPWSGPDRDGVPGPPASPDTAAQGPSGSSLRLADEVPSEAPGPAHPCRSPGRAGRVR